MNEPTITDWISAIGTILGIPAVVVGIFQLFRKNRELESQLNSLKELSIAQNESVRLMDIQVSELSRQTSEFQYQTEHMREANIIASKHLELLNIQFIKNASEEERKSELQRLQRIAKIKPHFTFLNGLSKPEEFQVTLLNKGNIAVNLELTNIGNDFVIFNPVAQNQEIAQDEKLRITGYSDMTKTYYNSNLIAFDAQLSFQDVDGNKYYQKISRHNQSYKITNPEMLIQE